MTLTYDQLDDLRQKMKAAQDESAPFPLTYAEIAEAWGVTSNGYVSHMLKRLFAAGMVQCRYKGKKVYWWAK